MQRLKEKKFPYYHENNIIDGGQMDTLNHFDEIDAFLDQHFKADQVNGCSRK